MESSSPHVNTSVTSTIANARRAAATTGSSDRAGSEECADAAIRVVLSFLGSSIREKMQDVDVEEYVAFEAVLKTVDELTEAIR